MSGVALLPGIALPGIVLPGAAFAPLASYLRERTVQVATRAGSAGGQGTGSGVIWSGDTVITNAHVACSDRVAVTLHDGRLLEGTVRLRDRRRDLAAVRIAASGLLHAIPGDSSAVRAGELVFAAGNPLGVTGAVSQGVIHAAGTLDFRPGLAWLQADVRLAPGSSGGPLANACGEVLGINTMIFAGLALAVPSNAVTRFLAGVATPRLGVTLRPVQVDGQAAILLLEIEPDGAAARAGHLPGDVILRSHAKLAAALDAAAISGEMQFDFLRGGRVLSNVISFRLKPAEARAA